MVVADPTAWVFEGTAVEQGDHLPDIVGPEYDRYDPSVPGPDNVQILAHSPLRCGGRSSYSDMTYYTHTSGGGVFATGTNWWISHLVAPCAGGDCPHDARAVRITENVLRAFGTGPSGREHPSVPNWRTLIGAGTTRTTSAPSRATNQRDAVPYREQYTSNPGVVYDDVVESTDGNAVR